MWMLSLRGVLGAAGQQGSGQGLDPKKAVWQRVSRKGSAPSPRSGAVMTLYKNKGLLFGGVVDTEGPRHSLQSTFYNDMHAFDMERRRWYQLGLKTPKSLQGKLKSKKQHKSSSLLTKVTS
jgi:N-acetylneuraminic acid mutarotase